MREVNGLVIMSAAVFLTLTPATIAVADPIKIDFDSVAATFVPPAARTGALTTLSVDQDNLTVTITRPGSVFDVVENVASHSGKPASFGLRSLDPFFAQDSATPFVLDFSRPLTMFSVSFGDYGGDAGDIVSLVAFGDPGASGPARGSTWASLDTTAFPGFVTVTVSSSDTFRSVAMIGGTATFPQSVFFDNLEATVPEPHLWFLWTSAAGAVFWRCRVRPAIRSRSGSRSS